MNILCLLVEHKWKFYKRWHYLKNPLTPEFKILRQWKRCLRCDKRVVTPSKDTSEFYLKNTVRAAASIHQFYPVMQDHTVPTPINEVKNITGVKSITSAASDKTEKLRNER